MKSGTLLFLIVCPLLMLLALPGSSYASKPAHFDYPTKLMNLETGYVLGPGGGTQIGLGESGFGIAGRMQFTTNTMLDMLTFVNGQVKLGLLQDSGPVPALAAGFGYYNLVSSNLLVGTAVRKSFADEEMDLSSGLECYYFFASMSERLMPQVRIHAGYQYRYLEGYITSNRPLDLSSEGDTVAVFLSLNQSANHQSMLGGLDIDLIDNLKVLFEFGYDLSYERPRGGVGVRLGIFDSFNLQLGALWPGAELSDNVSIPLIPHFSMFWRF